MFFTLGINGLTWGSKKGPCRRRNGLSPSKAYNTVSILFGWQLPTSQKKILSLRFGTQIGEKRLGGGGGGRVCVWVWGNQYFISPGGSRERERESQSLLPFEGKKQLSVLNKKMPFYNFIIL